MVSAQASFELPMRDEVRTRWEWFVALGIALLICELLAFERLARRDRWVRRQSSLAAVACVLNVPAMQQPEAYIGRADKLFDADGKLANDAARSFLQTFMQSFAAWITSNIKS